MESSNEVNFGQELRDLVDKYSTNGLMPASEMVAVLEFTKHYLIHAAEALAEEDEDSLLPPEVAA